MPIIGSNPVKIHLGQVRCEICFQITYQRIQNTCIILFGWSWTTLTGLTDDFILENFLIPQCIVKFAKIHLGFKLFFWVSFKSLDFLLEIIWGKSATLRQICSLNQKAIYFPCMNTIVKSSKFQLFLYKVKVKKMSILFFVARKVIVFMEIQVSFLLLSFA